MTAEAKALPVAMLPGLQPDSLGDYLASLGVLRVLSRVHGDDGAKWPDVRVAWRSEVFCVVGGPVSVDELVAAISGVGWRQRWSAYNRGWGDAQKKSTRAKSGRPLALYQKDLGEQDIELLAAHAVPAARVAFNPLLGSGGNAGKRAFAKGWKAAVDALAQPSPPKKAKKGKSSTADGSEEQSKRREQLRRYLLGEPVTWLVEKLNAASWFADANKLYNSGQRPFREGGISPWAMALACEGLVFFAGGASRRLGARARSVGAFPFVTRGAAPERSGEAGRDLAEVWVPIWARPMTLPEVRALFARGRAEIHGRGVLTPSGFATAIVGRGVDAGISEFRRFVLGRTTSANTFEPRFEGTFPIAHAEKAASTRSRSTAFERLLPLVDQLRRIAESRNAPASWLPHYVGRIEAAILAALSAPGDAERAIALLDAVVVVVDRLDRNRSFRERKVGWQPLPLAWLPSLFDGTAPADEARLALSLVSGFTRDRPFTLYRFGVTKEPGGRWVHPERAPARWSWRPGPLPGVLCDVLWRATLDREVKRTERGAAPVARPFLLPANHQELEAWLSGGVDDDLVSRWISRLALFDWSFVPPAVQHIMQGEQVVLAPSGALSLYGVLQPFFDERPVQSSDAARSETLLSVASGARTPAVARTLASLLRVGQVDAGMRLARSRYSMARSRLIETSVPWSTSEPERLLASFLFSLHDGERTSLAGRWLRPQRQGDHGHA